MDLHYYHGDCSTPEAQAQIKRNFIDILNNSFRYSKICRDPVVKDKCKAENVKVTCSMVNDTIYRKKRSLGELQIENVVKIILLLWKTKPGLYQGILGATREYNTSLKKRCLVKSINHHRHDIMEFWENSKAGLLLRSVSLYSR